MMSRRRSCYWRMKIQTKPIHKIMLKDCGVFVWGHKGGPLLIHAPCDLVSKASFTWKALRPESEGFSSTSIPIWGLPGPLCLARSSRPVSAQLSMRRPSWRPSLFQARLTAGDERYGLGTSCYGHSSQENWPDSVAGNNYW